MFGYRALAFSILLLAAITGRGAAAQDVLERVERAMRAGDARTAASELESRLQASPQDAAALRALGIVRLRLGDAAAAERHLRAAQDAGMPEAEVAAPLAQALMMQDRTEALLLAVRPGERPAATEGEVRFWRGLAQSARNDHTAALASFDDAARLLPDDPRPHIAKAQQLTSLHRLDEAEQAADAAVQRSTDSAQRADALSLKGELRRMADDGAAAARLFAEALLTDPDSRSALIGRATLAMAEGKPEAAEKDARQVLDTAPDHPVARYLVASAQAARNQLVAALATLHDAERSGYPPSLLLRATLRLNRGDLELARHDIEQYQSMAGRDGRSQRLRGALLLRLHEPELAVKALQDAAAQQPGDVQTAALLAAAHMLSGDLGAAARSLDSDTGLQAMRDLERQMPGSPLPPTLAGTVLAARGDAAAARAELEQALRLDASFIPALLTLGRLEAAEGRPEPARRNLMKILSLDDRHAAAMTALADLAARQGQPDAARRWLERAVAANPEALPARLEQIELLLRGGDSAGALVAARQLAAEAPAEPAALEALGKAAWAAGDRDEALAVFRRLAAAMPKAAKAHMLLASALAATGQDAEALQSAGTAAGLDDTYLPAQAQHLQLLIAAGRGAEAVAAAEAWRGRHPGQTAGELLLADAHLRLGQGAAAAAVLEQAFARRPSTTLAIRLAEARLRAGTGEQAAAGLGEWLAQHPDQTAARSALAALFLRLGKLQQAQAEFETVVAADAGNAVALNNLAWLYDRAGDPRALALAEQAYRLNPGSPHIADTLGTILVRRQQTARGLKLLREAHAGAPQVPDIRYHLAAALAQAGETDEARRMLDDLVAENAQFEEAAAARELRESCIAGAQPCASSR